MKKHIYFYDIEQYPNFHCNTFVNRDDQNEIRRFVIHRSRNDLKEYLNFLHNNVAGLIGFNCLKYDYPLLHMLLKNIEWVTFYDADEINYLLYEESQRLITTEDYVEIYNPIIPQLDLYRVWHFDNKAKRMSLKAVEIAIQYENVQDLPYPFDEPIEDNMIQNVVDYNYNDVNATSRLYDITVGNTENELYKGKDKIQLRRDIMQEYSIPCMNYNDVKLGNQIILNEYCKATGTNPREVKDQRTYRKIIKGNEIVEQLISFQTPEFNRILNLYKNIEITSTKLEEEYKDEFHIIYKGFKYDYGLGGIHGSSTGIFRSEGNNIIIDIDVASFYPSYAVNFGIYPRHLGPMYCKVYAGLRDKRIRAKNEGKLNISEALKLALNGGAFGKSNSADNFMYDPLYAMKTTINCQLFISMLAEDLVLKIPNIKILQINTDGETVIINKNDRELFNQICNSWMEKTGFILEFQEYKTMVVKDVSNYLAEKPNGKLKTKGSFEIDTELHKNGSMKIVPIALADYYTRGILPEITLREHTNIYDFCKTFRATKGWQTQIRYIRDFQQVTDNSQKTTRYFISTNGVGLLKKNLEDNREISVEAKKNVTLFNKYYFGSIRDYKIDYQYYIKEVYKQIYTINDGQLNIFL